MEIERWPHAAGAVALSRIAGPGAVAIKMCADRPLIKMGKRQADMVEISAFRPWRAATLTPQGPGNIDQID